MELFIILHLSLAAGNKLCYEKMVSEPVCKHAGFSMAKLTNVFVFIALYIQA